ncbi:hypothetical protein DdX_00510 [Ditylenchus destructor]|uniref:DUF4773 domain-containing protein n=1 Tax=Ditylenchus destructor TaxID=166010 RepID=A0AAD4NIV6_9BILA|nr:hypothetical protein DdX_00510 [Ditylenchus destructor]
MSDTRLLYSIIIVIGSFCLFPHFTQANPSSSFLDVYLRIQPADDFCGARECNVTYAVSVLAAQNQFDLQSVMLLYSSMRRDTQRDFYFEDNTVIRLTRELLDSSGKLYLGIMLFDVPDDIQDYTVVEVTDVIHKGRRTKVEFSSETARIQVNVYKRREALLTNEVMEKDEFSDTSEHIAGRTPHNRFYYGHRESHTTELDSLDDRDTSDDEGCACAKHECGCCQHTVIRKIHLNDTTCVNVSYISEDIGLRLTLSVNSYVYYSKEISVRNPPPVCFGVPHLREYASLCMRLYNVSISETELSACSELEAKLYHVSVARRKLGCFRMPL